MLLQKKKSQSGFASLGAMAGLVVFIIITGFILNIPEEKSPPLPVYSPSVKPVEYRTNLEIYAPPTPKQMEEKRRAKLWALFFIVLMAAIVFLQGSSFHKPRKQKTEAPQEASPVPEPDLGPSPEDPFSQDIFQAQRLLHLKNLHMNQLVSDEEYLSLKQRILKETESEIETEAVS